MKNGNEAAKSVVTVNADAQEIIAAFLRYRLSDGSLKERTDTFLTDIFGENAAAVCKAYRGKKSAKKLAAIIRKLLKKSTRVAKKQQKSLARAYLGKEQS